jgi:hypothetical protein
MHIDNTNIKITFDDFSRPLIMSFFIILFIFIFFSCIYLVIIIIDSVYRQFLDIYRYYNYITLHNNQNSFPLLDDDNEIN